MGSGFCHPQCENIRTVTRGYRKYNVQYPKVSLVKFEMSDQPDPAVRNLETRVQSV